MNKKKKKEKGESIQLAKIPGLNEHKTVYLMRYVLCRMCEDAGVCHDVMIEDVN